MENNKLNNQEENNDRFTAQEYIRALMNYFNVEDDSFLDYFINPYLFDENSKENKNEEEGNDYIRTIY